MNIQNRTQQITRVVALGGSAGGFEAIGEFFDHVPPNSVLAFVAIIHRSQKSKHDLYFYFQSHSDMSVKIITNGLIPQPDTIYFPPYGRDVILVDGAFEIIHPEKGGPIGSINRFFSSLASSEHQNGIAIVFSGCLNDGSEGLKEVKKNNGTTIAQDPLSARYPSIPQSAIETGAVDYIFAPNRIAEFLVREFGMPAAIFEDFKIREDNLIAVYGNLSRMLMDLKRPILVLDSDLKIIGFSGNINKLIPVSNEDIGRPATDLQLMIDYNSMKSDVLEVLRTLRIKEIEVAESNGSRYLIRIAPWPAAPSKNLSCIISFVDLENIAGYEETLTESDFVAPFGIVLAHVDTELRYTWVLNPHPDFSAKDVIGRTDVEISQNDGTSDLMALKKRVLDSGRSEEKIILFPLSEGLIPYRISAMPLYNNQQHISGVSTVGVELTSLNSTNDK